MSTACASAPLACAYGACAFDHSGSPRIACNRCRSLRIPSSSRAIMSAPAPCSSTGSSKGKGNFGVQICKPYCAPLLVRSAPLSVQSVLSLASICPGVLRCVLKLASICPDVPRSVLNLASICPVVPLSLSSIWPQSAPASLNLSPICPEVPRSVLNLARRPLIGADCGQIEGRRGKDKDKDKGQIEARLRTD